MPLVYAHRGGAALRPENTIAYVAIAEAFLSAHLGGVYAPIIKEELAASSMKIKAGKAGIPGLSSPTN